MEYALRAAAFMYLYALPDTLCLDVIFVVGLLRTFNLS